MVFEICPQHRAHGDRRKDQHAAHRRRACFRQVRDGPVFAYRLADLVDRQSRNHARPNDEGQDQCRQGAEYRAHSQVIENVEAGFELREVVGQIQEHA